MMFKAITTQYFGPTNYKGSRIKATDLDGNSVTVSYNHALNGDQNHVAAAKALATKMGWNGRYFGGALKRGYAFVNVGTGTNPEFELEGVIA